jgi:TonB family protein
MSLIFSKAKPAHTIITLMVTAVHVAIILFGLFSFNARSQHGPQIMVASLIDHPATMTSTSTSTSTSTNITTNTKTQVSKTTLTQKSQDRPSENTVDDEEQGMQSKQAMQDKPSVIDDPSAVPVTMPNPFAKGLNNPKPPYPLISRRLNEEGKVVLNVCVSLSGLVENLKLEKTSGYRRLDDIAIETVKKWKFIPAKIKDRDTNACYLLPVQFILRKEQSRLNS